MTGMAYDTVLGLNINAARSRRNIGEQDLAERMRQLGFSGWQQQTVASAEQGEYSLSAEEILGLSAALYSSVSALMLPPGDDPVEVILPGGQAIGFKPSLWWDGNIPTTIPQPVEKTRHW